MNFSLRRLRSVSLILALFGLAGLISACGTPYATVPDGDGKPVMLLGHDPVAYFREAAPARGRKEHQVSLPAGNPTRTYYFASEQNRLLFEADPAKYEPQYGGFCASGAAFAIKLGSDPTAWQIHDGRLFIFGDIIGKTAWQLDPDWNIRHADEVWPEMRDRGWRGQSLARYVNKVPWYQSGEQIRETYEKRHLSRSWPRYDPGGMISNLFLKLPGWRAAEGFGQPALGYPK